MADVNTRRSNQRSRVSKEAGVEGWLLRHIGLLGIIILLIAWFVVSELRLVSNLKLPYPIGVWQTVVQLNWGIFLHLGVTLYRVFAGFAIGSILGIIIGLLMSWKPTINSLLDPFVEAIRPIPALAFIPFFILWMGIGDKGKLVLVALGSFLTLVITTTEAVRNVPPVYIYAAQTLGASESSVYRSVILNAIVPNLMGGIRIAAAGSFALEIASEFMGAQTGIGYIIMVAQRTLQTDSILYGMIILAVISFGTDRAIRAIGRYVTRWTEQRR